MITIIDYGVGNINAIHTVYRNLNIPITVASKPSDLVNSEKLILPGVGTFDFAMEKLNRSGLRDKLNKLVTENDVPILGICVGMQMMTERSEEGQMDGLGWVKGDVLHFKHIKPKGKKMDVPHVGWNNIIPKRENPILAGLDNNSYFYFLHSYYCEAHDDTNVVSTTKYGNYFTSTINDGNLFGVQFHPEKSHQFGIQLLKNFSEL
jgi:imidazole glycerol-phosphate synthase subunit HisH